MLRRLFFKKGSFGLVLCSAAVFGALLGLFCKQEVTLSLLAGGFAHSFPGSFSADALAKAVVWQMLPLLLIYYSAYGVLVRPTCTILLALRGVLCGYNCLLFGRCTDFSDPIGILLFCLFLLFEGLTVSLHASFSHLASSFSVAVCKGKGKNGVWRFTGDMLFFYGLILFLYILRGCIVALMNS